MVQNAQIAAGPGGLGERVVRVASWGRMTA